jgi:hypothetical protein
MKKKLNLLNTRIIDLDWLSNDVKEMYFVKNENQKNEFDIWFEKQKHDIELMLSEAIANQFLRYIELKNKIRSEKIETKEVREVCSVA